MMLHPNSPKGARLRSWRGRHKNFRVLIHEVLNTDLQTVDKYSYVVMSSVSHIHYDSLSDNMLFDTIDSTKDAAIERINEYKERIRNRVDIKVGNIPMKINDIVIAVDSKSLPSSFVGMYGRVTKIDNYKVTVEFKRRTDTRGSLSHTAYESDLKKVGVFDELLPYNKPGERG